MIFAVTGPRPNKLYGYNILNDKWRNLRIYFEEFLKNENCTEGITGMALGVDTIFALAIINLKRQGYDIKLHCALPCKNQESMWNERDRKLYHMILKEADEIKYVSKKEYDQGCMQKRNEYMVNKCNMVLAVYNDSIGKSGTFNCITYAKKVEKPIIFIDPFTLKAHI